MTDPTDLIWDAAAAQYVPHAVSERTRARRAARAERDAIPLPPFAEKAFDVAVDTFHQRYTLSYSAGLRTGAGHDKAHQEALRDALESFLGCYTELAS